MAATGPPMDLAVRIGSVGLPNPVMTASGTAGHGAELGAFMDLSELGAVVVKSLSADPWPGNPPPRIVPAAAGMLNSVGLQNPGLRAWAQRDLPELHRAGARVVVSVWGRSAGDYARVGELVALTKDRGGPARSLVAVEANISCPNVEDRQRMFSHSPCATTEAVCALVGALSGTGLPVWAKLSPNVTDLVGIADAAISAGAEALTLVNTLMGMSVDPTTGTPRLGAGGGGLSGPALHPVAVRAVWECRRAFPQVAIVGVGGIVDAESAAEMMAAGADAVQVGTASFVDPRACERVLAELTGWCRSQGVVSIEQMRARWQDGPVRDDAAGARVCRSGQAGRGGAG